MATSAGGRPPKRGRPKLGIAIKRIGLQANIYDEWITKKKDLGFADKSNSDFAKYLLGFIDEQRGQISPSAVGEFISNDIFYNFKDLRALFRTTQYLLCFAHVRFKVRVIQRLWESRKDPIWLIVLPYLPWRMNLVMMSKSMST